MLDVHPPHPPPHTWRDFLIHIEGGPSIALFAMGGVQPSPAPNPS
jgi:hypothetical protein